MLRAYFGSAVALLNEAPLAALDLVDVEARLARVAATEVDRVAEHGRLEVRLLRRGEHLRAGGLAVLARGLDRRREHLDGDERRRPERRLEVAVLRGVAAHDVRDVFRREQLHVRERREVLALRG